MQKATVEKHELCENYANVFYARVDRRQAALSAVAEHINALAELKQILEEDDDEEIEELLFNFKKRKQ